MITRFDRIHEHGMQTDRRTDGQTLHDGIGRAYAQHRADKNRLNHKHRDFFLLLRLINTLTYLLTCFPFT